MFIKPTYYKLFLTVLTTWLLLPQVMEAQPNKPQRTSSNKTSAAQSSIKELLVVYTSSSDDVRGPVADKTFVSWNSIDTEVYKTSVYALYENGKVALVLDAPYLLVNHWGKWQVMAKRRYVFKTYKHLNDPVRSETKAQRKKRIKETNDVLNRRSKVDFSEFIEHYGTTNEFIYADLFPNAKAVDDSNVDLETSFEGEGAKSKKHDKLYSYETNPWRNLGQESYLFANEHPIWISKSYVLMKRFDYLDYGGNHPGENETYRVTGIGAPVITKILSKQPAKSVAKLQVKLGECGCLGSGFIKEFAKAKMDAAALDACWKAMFEPNAANLKRLEGVVATKSEAMYDGKSVMFFAPYNGDLHLMALGDGFLNHERSTYRITSNWHPVVSLGPVQGITFPFAKKSTSVGNGYATLSGNLAFVPELKRLPTSANIVDAQNKVVLKQDMTDENLIGVVSYEGKDVASALKSMKALVK